MVEPSTAGRSNLPAARTPIHGRQAELEAAGVLLAKDGRLVTITGAPGVGKSRLAVDVARTWHQAEADRSALRVNATEAGSPEALVAAVAAELELGPTSGAVDRAVVQVGGALATEGKLLLVLDNFEHLVAFAEDSIGCWLEQAPELRVMVTSRQALSIPGEQRFELRTFDRAEAIDFFVARAKMAVPTFEVSDAQGEIIGELIDRLDRLPLAIELAAPRSAIFSPKEILKRLDERLDLLELDGKQLDRRHVTLRGTIDWSWSLLDEAERDALCACAVCAGSFGLDVLGALLGSESAAMRMVQSLREKSLLHDASADESGFGGEVRFELLQGVRDFAREKLKQSPDRGRGLRQSHARFFGERAAAWSAAVRGPEGSEALGQLRREADNMLAACRFTADDDPPGAVKMALAVSEALSLAGPHGVHLAVLDAAVSTAEGHDPGGQLYVWALIHRGNARLVAGDRRAAAEDLEGAVADARAQGDAETEARAQHRLGVLRRDEGEFDEGRKCLERAALLFKEAGNQAMLARIIGNFATLERQAGRYEAARASYERAMSLQRELGDRLAEGHSLAGLGHLEAAAGSPDEALRRYEAALPLLVEVGDRRTEGIVLGAMGVIACEAGDLDRAVSVLDDAGTRLGEVGDRLHAAVQRARRASVLSLMGQPKEARDDLAAAERELAENDDPRLRASFRGAEACVWLAEAQLTGDAPFAVRLRQRARRVVRSLRADAGAPGAPREEYVNTSCRLLERCLTADPGSGVEEAVAPARPAAAAAPVRSDSADQLRVAGDGSWFEVGGQRGSLGRTPVLARMLAVLAERRQAEPGEPLSPADLFAQVWPAEAVEGRVATNRLYVAVAKLRRRGLDGVLIRQGGGYLLHPAIDCVLIDT